MYHLVFVDMLTTYVLLTGCIFVASNPPLKLFFFSKPNILITTSRVFKYEERPTSVPPLIRTMNDDNDWNTWFEEEHPKLDGSQSGLVFILARRGGEARIDPRQRMQSSDCVRDIERVASGFKEAPKDAIRGTGGQQTLRNIPFSAQTFKRIAKEFRIHNSIIRHVSRADVPDFSAVKLDMELSNHQPLPRCVFDREISNLNRFATKDAPHLIQLLWTFSLGSEYHLVFPCADGNLMDLWRQHKSPLAASQDHETALWFSRQCLGIVEGLEMIHQTNGHDSDEPQKYGRHGDLEPENILWFRNASNMGPGYSLACVLLEFTTWYLNGWAAVDKFAESRKNEDSGPRLKEDTFFNHIHQGNIVSAVAKKSVAAEMRSLYEHSDASDLTVDLLELVETDLLHPVEMHRQPHSGGLRSDDKLPQFRPRRGSGSSSQRLSSFRQSNPQVATLFEEPVSVDYVVQKGMPNGQLQQPIKSQIKPVSNSDMQDTIDTATPNDNSEIAVTTVEKVDLRTSEQEEYGQGYGQPDQQRDEVGPSTKLQNPPVSSTDLQPEQKKKRSKRREKVKSGLSWVFCCCSR
ncbi:hypothetical protein FGRA07_08092 [Fusarium graminearum]|nr:hypothetical protein FGRA07_08092 [Fusarium graminearum]